MAYCTRADLETKFGKANVLKWADLDGNKDQTDISARITAAIAEADREIDMVLAGRFDVPFGTVPGQVLDLSVRLAAAALYDGRGVVDADSDGNPVNRLAPLKNWALNRLRFIAAGAYPLSGVTPAVSSYPTVIDVDDSDSWEDYLPISTIE